MTVESWPRAAVIRELTVVMAELLRDAARHLARTPRDAADRRALVKERTRLRTSRDWFDRAVVEAADLLQRKAAAHE